MKSHFGFKFNSEINDPYLYGMAVIVLTALIKDKKISEKNIQLDEYKMENTYLYYFSINKLTAYMGRDKTNSRIYYLLIDNSRFKWAEAEGFYDDPTFGREQVFEKIGAMRRLADINDFVNFLSGGKFKTVGPYLKSTPEARE